MRITYTIQNLAKKAIGNLGFGFLHSPGLQSQMSLPEMAIPSGNINRSPEAYNNRTQKRDLQNSKYSPAP